ncbi:hypothetical protein N866_13600 [Actinotalea ferrariae CF5-4]|uniref:Uncharacterized protein n=1 Tax=Actinotalea ferrariae CF5-4 TaxID=948458 RepID=A0A021VT24_9CELL|nr:hypothetical protein [Actinotalea ferrariae]EYR64278.1 hypothetical protein N866_13600 [Actinotalea ferrariae CF5-4]
MIDARKHTAPAAGETPRRQAINDLSMSIRDVIPVANTTERAQLVSDLTAAGAAPSTTNPVSVYRADAPAGARVEWTDDDTTWSRPRETRAGIATGTTSAGGDISVTFSPAFATTPAGVTVSDSNIGAGIGMIFWKVHSLTATGFIARAMNATGTSPVTELTTSFHYIAVGA